MAKFTNAMYSCNARACKVMRKPHAMDTHIQAHVSVHTRAYIHKYTIHTVQVRNMTCTYHRVCIDCVQNNFLPPHMCSAANRITLKVPTALTLTTFTKSSSGWGPFLLSVRMAIPIPAQLTTVFKVPYFSLATLMTSATSFSWVTLYV